MLSPLKPCFKHVYSAHTKHSFSYIKILSTWTLLGSNHTGMPPLACVRCSQKRHDLRSLKQKKSAFGQAPKSASIPFEGKYSGNDPSYATLCVLASENALAAGKRERRPLLVSIGGAAHD